jgi:RNA polymerase primary sigma factor
MKRYLKEIQNHNPLLKGEEAELLRLAKAGDRKAYDTVITSNLRFVVKVAKEYQNQGISLEDLIAEGNLGLVKAFSKFDTSRNFKFITYAVWWIRQAIMASIHEHAKMIRLPLNKITNVTKITKAREYLETKLQRVPSYDEIAELVDNPNALQDLKYSYTVIHLDEPHTDNDDTLTNVIPAIASSVELEHLIDEFREEFDDVISSFPAREKQILKMYFGIGHIRPYTLRDIGIDLGLTRERIRQIKEQALNKLRRTWRADKLRYFMDDIHNY